MHSFTKHSTTYTIIDKVDDYTIIHRETDFQPWVVAYGFDTENNSWIQGYYCNTLESAVYTAKKANFWSKDWNIKDGEQCIVAIKRETDGRLGMSPEEWVTIHFAEYSAENDTFIYDDDSEYFIEDVNLTEISASEILGVIPIADPYDLL